MPGGPIVERTDSEPESELEQVRMIASSAPLMSAYEWWVVARASQLQEQGRHQERYDFLVEQGVYELGPDLSGLD
jgi:hypothetical protein